MLFVGTSIIHPSTEGVFLLCNILDLLIYSYHTRFALPLYNNKNKTEEYNVYTVCLVINCASNGKLYLYDIVDIKKEASNPLKTENSQVVQNRFF